MKSIVLVLTIALTSAGLAFGRDLETYRTTYEKAMDAIRLSHSTKTNDLGQRYAKALDTLSAEVRRAGDFEKTTAVMDERARFRQERRMPDKLSGVLDIHSLQSSFIRQASAHEVDRAKRVISLAAQYEQALQRLQRRLVSSDKLDDAIAVKEERLRLQEARVCIDAKEVLAPYKASRHKQPKRAVRVEPPKRHRSLTTPCTMHWSCADVADVYLNGEPVCDHTQSFHSRRDEAGLRFSREVVCKTGDVITVGARRGGSYGFLLVIVDQDGNVVWQTDRRKWKVYYPKDKRNWYEPEVAMRSRKHSPRRQREPWPPQMGIREEFDTCADSIWDDEDEMFAYFACTISLK